MSHHENIENNRDLRNDVKSLLEALIGDDLPSDLQSRLRDWYVDDDNRELKDEELEDIFTDMLTERGHNDEAIRKYAELAGRLGLSNAQEAPGRGAAVNKRITGFKRIALRVAAVVVPVAMILGGAIFFRGEDGDLEHRQASLLTVTTGIGEVKYVEMPDCSKIWLGESTTITYPEDFADNREVTLEGEAFFDVEHMDGKPFVVASKDIVVKVLGTEFNVRGYPEDEAATVALASGRVEVSSTSGGETYILSPMEQFTYDLTADRGQVTRFSQKKIHKWKNESIELRGTPLRDAFMLIGNLYEVGIVIEGRLPQGKRVNITISKADQLTDVLDVFRHIVGGLNYRIEGDTVFIEAE